MSINNRLTHALALGLLSLLGACSNTPVATDSLQASAQLSRNGRQDPARGNAVPTAGSGSVPAHMDPRSLLAHRRSVYFEFDRSNIRTDYVPLLELHGRYLAANPSISVKVEGNADEQGGAEYNLALGQRRADAVVSALKIYGAKDAQLEAVSYGEEKPRELGHEEAAYKLNRRADLVYR